MDGEGKKTSNSFTDSELRDLYRLHENVECQTHDLLQCSCGGSGMPAQEEESESEEGSRNKPKLVSASELLKEGERAPRAPKRMKSLLDYAHIDPQVLSDAEYIHPDALLHRVCAITDVQMGKVGYVFARHHPARVTPENESTRDPNDVGGERGRV